MQVCGASLINEKLALIAGDAEVEAEGKLQDQHSTAMC
jgi:hypothetical protein